MLGIDATFGDVSFDHGRNPGRVLHKIVPGAVALALIGPLGAWVLHMRPAAAPESVHARSAAAPTAAPAGEVASKPFGDLIIDPSFLTELKSASPKGNLSPLASLEAVPPAPSSAMPLPSLEAVPPASSAAIPENVPLPPKRDVPQIADIAPLPPPRPA
jgi:hypothetical protein